MRCCSFPDCPSPCWAILGEGLPWVVVNAEVFQRGFQGILETLLLATLGGCSSQQFTHLEIVFIFQTTGSWICINKEQTQNWLRACRALTLKRLGYFGSWKNWGGGGGAYKAPPWDLGRGSHDHHKNLHNGSVRCNLHDRIFRFSKMVFFYFILINYANLCKKSDFLL